MSRHGIRKRYWIIATLLFLFCLLTSCTADSPGYMVASNPSGDPLTVDPLSNTLAIIDYPHYEAHVGRTFSVWRNGDIAGGATEDTLIITPNSTTEAHIIIKIETESEASYALYETATVSANGTPTTPYNRDRNSLNAASVTVFFDPTVTAPGTVIMFERWGSGKQMGGEERSEQEWILRRNTKYLLRVVNESVSANNVSIILLWYELPE